MGTPSKCTPGLAQWSAMVVPTSPEMGPHFHGFEVLRDFSVIITRFVTETA